MSNEGSIPSLPTVAAVSFDEVADAGLVQALFQENQVLREQISRHTHLMQLLTHQLATPLTSLSGSVHLLADADLDAEHRKEFLGVVEQQIRRLQTFLQDMMALRDLETGGLEVQPVSFCLSSLVQEVLVDFAPYPMVLQFGDDVPEVWGDRWQISQILVNLISNAIKYSPNGQAIEVGAAPNQAGWVDVWVKDQGLGIPAADQPHLFERFYRVGHSDRQNIAGTGLGLSLCKLLVENYGGQMGFESTHGEGSRFYFTLPTAEMANR